MMHGVKATRAKKDRSAVVPGIANGVEQRHEGKEWALLRTASSFPCSNPGCGSSGGKGGCLLPEATASAVLMDGPVLNNATNCPRMVLALLLDQGQPIHEAD